MFAERNMDIEKSYFVVSRFFNTWVRLMEYQTRMMEVVESAQLGPRRLIISPPTDAGIPLLALANAPSETGLLCFSDRIERMAKDYCRRRRVDTLTTFVEPFFTIPALDESLSAVYANCLFDFCAMETFDSMFREIWRVLVPGGLPLVSPAILSHYYVQEGSHVSSLRIRSLRGRHL
jgi:hypothetical protein